MAPKIQADQVGWSRGAPAPSEWFTAYRVSPKINSPANDDPALIAPLEEAAGDDEAPEPPDPRPRLL